MEDFGSKVQFLLENGFFNKSDLEKVKTPDEFSRLIREKVVDFLDSSNSNSRCSNKNCEAHWQRVVTNNNSCRLCSSSLEKREGMFM